MTRTCTVCTHKDIDKINKMLLTTETHRNIAKRFGTSESAMYRHKESHIPEILLKSKDVQETANADSLLDQLRVARERTFSLLDKAEAAADTRVYGAPVAYLREIREQLKFMAELEGRLATQPTVNILINPQWVELRSVIIKALEPHPEAREAVLHALG